MARPLSDDKRQAILEAAIRVIAAKGLGAPTAVIAREAGVANGSLFIYFETKAELWNALYVELKTEMASASKDGAPPDADPKAALQHAWTGWVLWASSQPQRRRALALLGTSGEITPQTRRAGENAMAPLAKLLEQCRAEGPMRDLSIGFVAGLITATAEATIDFILGDPENAARYQRSGFEALWRMIS
jgi:AcrR family transcriptional regulator